VVLASRRIAALNPTIKVKSWAEPLHAGNVVEVFQQFDLVVECTDDMRSRYLSSDAAVLSGTPLILASIYQYEGQLQVVAAKPDTPCLRCLWPQEPAPETVGSCTESGVLGPVPGVLGAMQATEALKMLLGLPQPNESSLLLVNLLDHTVQHLPIDLRQGCELRGGCIAIAREALGRAQQDGEIDLAFERLEDAVSAGFRLIDLREPEEIAAAPLHNVDSHRIPSTDVVAYADELKHGRSLLVCASGRRSGHAARLLRAQGVDDVHSLVGGLHALLPRRASESEKS
jgi:rhodanese-related sulfurtransferase